jgi:hypothetical protein
MFHFLVAEPGHEPRWTLLQGNGGPVGNGALHQGIVACMTLEDRILRGAQFLAERGDLVEHIVPGPPGRSFSTRPFPEGTEVLQCSFRGSLS